MFKRFKKVSELRKKCKQAGCEYKVYKNTLLRKALNELGYTQFDEDLKGPTAVAFANDEYALLFATWSSTRTMPESKLLSTPAKFAMGACIEPSIFAMSSSFQNYNGIGAQRAC